MRRATSKPGSRVSVERRSAWDKLHLVRAGQKYAGGVWVKLLHGQGDHRRLCTK